MARHRLNDFSFKLIAALVVVSLAVFLFMYLGRTVKNLDYFKIKDIMVNGNDTASLSYLKGQNIFTVDIRRESGYMRELYPTFRLIRLIRIFPNRLYIDFIKRKPQGIVKLYRYFCVDRDCVLFDCPAELTELDLPIITGLDTKIFGPKPGRKYNLKELALALNIIQETEKNSILKNYQVRRIGVLNPANTSFFIVAPVKLSNYPNERRAQEIEGLEVKIGQDDIKDRITILGALLTQTKKGLGNIEYIDLRFKEPVIKLKDAK